MRLPDFVVIGAQKCGTTATIRLLKKHPQIGVGCHAKVLGKSHGEAHFFDREYERGLPWYMQQFGNEEVVGEKTPAYIADPVAIQRLAAAVPDAKLIVMLRDPVTRLYSNYFHYLRQPDQVQCTFENWLRISAGAKALWRGVYWRQLQTIFDLFSRDQVLIEFQESMKRDTAGVMRKVQAFLGVDYVKLSSRPRRSKRPPMADATRSFLKRYYLPHNRMLRDLIERQEIDMWPPRGCRKAA